MTPTPDTLFYYVLSGLFGTALLAIFWFYISRLEKILETLTEQNHELKLMLAVHEEKIERLEDDMKKLK